MPQSHNHWQFQKVYQEKGLKLRQGHTHNTQVYYYPGRYVEICMEEDRGMLMLEKRKGESEEDFVCRAVQAFNKKEFNG